MSKKFNQSHANKIIATIEQVESDRDEWKLQHENLLSVRQSDLQVIAKLESKLSAVRLERGNKVALLLLDIADGQLKQQALQSQLSASEEARKKAEAEVGQLMQGRTNRGDSTAGTVKRFGIDATKLPLDVIPATNGAFVWFSDYEQLHHENESIQAEIAQLRKELEEAKSGSVLRGLLEEAYRRQDSAYSAYIEYQAVRVERDRLAAIVKEAGEQPVICYMRPSYESEYSDTFKENWIALFANPPIREGYMMVPIEPTEEMIKAALNSGFEGAEEHVIKDYKAMLAATPGKD